MTTEIIEVEIKMHEQDLKQAVLFEGEKKRTELGNPDDWKVQYASWNEPKDGSTPFLRVTLRSWSVVEDRQ